MQGIALALYANTGETATSTIDFPGWFSGGCYGGLACCMLVIAANTLYATWRKRGTRRQLTGGVVVCVVCALLLLVGVAWYDLRFNALQATLPLAEVEVALAYVVTLGWFLPLSTFASFCFFASDRVLTTSLEIPMQKRRTKINPSTALRPPRHQKGVLAAFVYDEDTPWCWLEYRSGRLQGQRLALKRAIVTIGREEDNDIWVDDEQASRYHAELAWDRGDVYLTDCDSLNGVLLNGRRINGSALIESGVTIDIGSHCFLFTLAEQKSPAADIFDPLNNHIWHSSTESLTGKGMSYVPPPTPMIFLRKDDTPRPPGFLHIPSVSGPSAGQQTPQLSAAFDTDTPRTTAIPHSLGISRLLASTHQTSNRDYTTSAYTGNTDSVRQSGEIRGMLLIRASDSLSGIAATRLLDKPLLTFGHGDDCDIVVYNATLARQHLQFTWQSNGDYVQTMSSQYGAFVNEALLMKPYLLRSGDVIRVGNIRLEYVLLRAEPVTPLPQSMSSVMPSMSPEHSHPISIPNQFQPPNTSGSP